MPKRIQRQRTAGWRMPEGAVYVGRGPGCRWGNPFKVGQRITEPAFSGARVNGVPLARDGVVEDRAHAVDLFSFWVLAKVPFTQADVSRELAGKDLVCWCPEGAPCHADVLLSLANDHTP